MGRFKLSRSLRFAAPLLALVATACTFTGLGNYDVETCAKPKGFSTTVQKVGAVTDLGFSSASGKSTIAAFAADVTGGACIEAVGPAGFLNTSCSFLADEPSLSPHQPMAVPLSGGFAAAIIATTAPCTVGQLEYRFNAPSVAGKANVPCPTGSPGATLPALAPLSDGSTVIVSWYATSYALRTDPISSCAGAVAAPIKVAIVTSAASAPVIGAPIDLGDTGISIRPPAIVAVPGSTQAIVAAPFGNDVSVWSIDTSNVSSNLSPASIPSLAGARAVAVGIASDNSGRIAIAAEIGCNPQSIALSVGTIAGGFSKATVVAAADGDLAVAPSVAWIDGQNRWVVGWVSSHGGAHALARSFDVSGNALAPALDPSTDATGASVTSDGSILGFVASSSSFVETSLGCEP